jgi:hypothetical protein
MITPGLHQDPTPERFFNAVNAHELTEAIKTGIELEIFTAIAEGNTIPATIAKRCEAAERGVRILCDFLAIHSFLTKEGANYRLAPDSALFLKRHSPAYIGSPTEFLLAPRLRECHAHRTEAVRRGGTALGEGTLEPENPDWVTFANAMTPLMSTFRDHGRRTPQGRRSQQWCRLMGYLHRPNHPPRLVLKCAPAASRGLVTGNTHGATHSRPRM